MPFDPAAATLSTTLAEYRATTGYDLPGGSRDMASRHIVAGRTLITFYSAEAASGTQRVRMDENIRQTEKAIAAAQRFLVSTPGPNESGSGGVVSYAFGSFGR